MRKISIIMALGLVLAFGLALPAAASTVPFTSQLSVGNKAISDQAGPYADLTITLNADNTAHFYFVADNSYFMHDVIGVELNLTDLTGISVANVTPSNVGSNYAYNGFALNSNVPISEFGKFNLKLDFNQGYPARFGDVAFDVTGATFTSAADVLKFNPNYDAAAGIITPKLVGDSFVTGFAGEPVPIPATLPLFGSGLLGLGLWGWRKVRS
jgi:hypothetical protein